MSEEETNAEVKEVTTATTAEPSPPAGEDDLVSRYRPIDNDVAADEAEDDDEAKQARAAMIKEWVKFGVFVAVLFGAVFVVYASRPIIFDGIVPAVMNLEGMAGSNIPTEESLDPSASSPQTDAQMESEAVEVEQPAESSEPEQTESQEPQAPLVIQEESNVTVDEANQPSSEQAPAEPAGDQPPGTEAEAASDVRTIPYTVEGGDSLYAIGQRYGVSVDEIIAANPGAIPNPNNILPGTEIQIPVP